MKSPGRFVFGLCAAAAVLAGCGTTAGPAPVANLLDAPAESSSNFKVVHNFSGSPDGANPLGSLVFDRKGALYGTTASGGTSSVCYPPYNIGCGTVFKLTPSGSGYSEGVIYQFKGYREQDGSAPVAGVVVDKKGAVYGTTWLGNPIGYGVLFKLSPAGSGYSESVLHLFAGSPDGGNSTANLTLLNKNILFGTTTGGGFQYGCYHFCGGCGTIFMATTSSGYKSNPYYSFCARSLGKQGSDPRAGVIFDKTGALYGTTSRGGTHNAGTVFRLGNAKFTVLHNFCGHSRCQDGSAPEAGLVFDSKGALYGTTEYGGGGTNAGVVFKLSPRGSGYVERILYRFRGSPDGAYPVAGLVLDRRGALYGTTSGGGIAARGCGVVFRLMPSGSGYSESVLHSFTGGSDGSTPKAGLIIDNNGNLYGTTSGGGSSDDGTVFELTP